MASYSYGICIRSLLDSLVRSGRQIAPAAVQLVVGDSSTSMVCREAGCIVMTQP